MKDKFLILVWEMVGKVVVMVDVCKFEDMLIIVWIDVIVVVGFDEVVECVEFYVEVGVDVLFIEVLCMFEELLVIIK